MQRAYDMIIHDMALQGLPVRLCMDRGGLSGDDGPTHHGLFDIGFLRHIPGIIHMQPKDEDEFVDMLHTMAAYDAGPSAIRYPRGADHAARRSKTRPRCSKSARPKSSPMAPTSRSSASARCLRWRNTPRRCWKPRASPSRSSTRVSSSRWTPRCSRNYARKCRVLCTFEDHVLLNGFGAGVIEHLHTAGIHTPVERIGWPDEFIEHGKPETLRELHGLTPEAAVAKIVAHFA